VQRHEGARVSGVFDLMECYFGDPDEDLVRTVFDFGPSQIERSRAFISAYRTIRPLRDRYEDRFVLNMLRDALLIWNFDHRRGHPPAPVGSFRAWTEPHLSLEVFEG
jgi:Ser/Thr protein kinase RdoA (MazF antagonist)